MSTPCPEILSDKIINDKIQIERQRDKTPDYVQHSFTQTHQTLSVCKLRIISKEKKRKR